METQRIATMFLKYHKQKKTFRLIQYVTGFCFFDQLLWTFFFLKLGLDLPSPRMHLWTDIHRLHKIERWSGIRKWNGRETKWRWRHTNLIYRWYVHTFLVWSEGSKKEIIITSNRTILQPLYSDIIYSVFIFHYIFFQSGNIFTGICGVFVFFMIVSVLAFPNGPFTRYNNAYFPE